MRKGKEQNGLRVGSSGVASKDFALKIKEMKIEK